MNKIYIYILFFLGTLISAFFYIIASYYFRYGQENNVKFKYILIISLFFGILSYLLKISTFYFFAKKVKVLLLHIIFLIFSSIIVYIYSKFYLKEKIKVQSLVIYIIIILLIILDSILNNKKS